MPKTCSGHSVEDHTRSIQQSTSTHTKHIHNIHNKTDPQVVSSNNSQTLSSTQQTRQTDTFKQSNTKNKTVNIYGKMLNLSGPNTLLFLQLLIALVTRSAVNLCVVSKSFLCLPCP